VKGLTDVVDAGTFVAGDVTDAVNFYYDFDSATGGEVQLATVDASTVQQTFNDVSSNKNLRGKTAGNDSATDHKDWSTEFVGWGDDSLSPMGLIEAWVGMLDQLATDRTNGTIPMDPDGNPVPEVYLTAEGHDLAQLLQKFLLGAVAFQQGADDYMDDDVDGKGLLAANVQDDDKPYTKLEHAWDEGYGYFGGAVNYVAYTDVQLSDGDFIDWDGDMMLDLKKEKNHGHSVNAGKRDKGAAGAGMEPTDFTAQAWAGFTQGRAVITAAQGESLTAGELAELQTHRDTALGAWEAAIAATCVHYINDVLQDMNSTSYEFKTHAKHWSELKGFGLTFQFNPRSPMSDADFAQFHQLIGDAPVLLNEAQGVIDAYEADLVSARTLLQNAYGFSASNMGDDEGQDGW
jgi:hypothetical protein